MDRFEIHGGRKLNGTVQISGAKNAALPAMAAALLTSDPVTLQNIPHVRDIITMAKLLAHMRCVVESPDLPPSEFIIQAENVSMQEAPYELVKTMRASVLTLGPLVARFGHARVSLPGGCAIGARPVDLHIQALESSGRGDQSGARLRGSAREAAARRDVPFPENHGDRHGKYSDRRGARRRRNDSRKFARWSRKLPIWPSCSSRWARKSKASALRRLRVQGVETLHGATHAIIPDRIETGTFLVAGAITGGDLAADELRAAAPEGGDREAARVRSGNQVRRQRQACACEPRKNWSQRT